MLKGWGSDSLAVAGTHTRCSGDLHPVVREYTPVVAGKCALCVGDLTIGLQAWNSKMNLCMKLCMYV